MLRKLISTLIAVAVLSLVAISAQAQELYWVAESANDQIVRMDLATKTTSVFATGLGTFATVAYNSVDNNIYVASSGKVDKYDRAGNNLGTYLTTNRTQPVDMLFDKVGNLYLSDFATWEVYKYGVDGTETPWANIAYPWGIDLAQDGDLLVLDMSNARLTKIVNGERVPLITGLNGPKHVGVAADGSIYVTQNSTGNVMKYNADGTGGSVFATVPNAYGLLCADNGKIYVTDTATYSIREYAADGTSVLLGGSSVTLGQPATMAYAPLNWEPPTNENPVPEPMGLMGLGTGLIGLVGFAVRRRK